MGRGRDREEEGEENKALRVIERYSESYMYRESKGFRERERERETERRRIA